MLKNVFNTNLANIKQHMFDVDVDGQTKGRTLTEKSIR